MQLYNLSRLNNESNIVGRIVKEHVKGSRPGTKFMLSTGVKESSLDQESCVYHFTCDVVSCRATYIGHTACKGKTRAQQHR